MKTSTGIIDYHLKYCIEGGFSKITIQEGVYKKRGCEFHLQRVRMRPFLGLKIMS
jgi:hypothetical protein